jgi:hypothetical protein
MNCSSQKLPENEKGPLPFAGSGPFVVRYSFRPLRPLSPPGKEKVEAKRKQISNDHNGLLVMLPEQARAVKPPPAEE